MVTSLLGALFVEKSCPCRRVTRLPKLSSFPFKMWQTVHMRNKKWLRSLFCDARVTLLNYTNVSLWLTNQGQHGQSKTIGAMYKPFGSSKGANFVLI